MTSLECEIPVDTPKTCVYDLLSGVDVTSTKGSGVLKQIVKEGPKKEDTPFHGDTVWVHYSGYLTDGTKFDSSRDRDEKFTFKLGEGSVIKGWDEGVKSMSKGEVARFIIKPAYGYGNQGSPPTIPGAATLVFDIELFEFEGEDLSEAKDKSVVRRIIDKGYAYTTPNDSARVVVNLRGTFADGKCFDNREKVEFELGDTLGKNIVPGLEVGLLKFKKLEEAKLYIKAEQAWGAAGHEEFKIPPNTDIIYEVTLVEFEKAKEAWQLNWEEKLKQSELFKSKGTELFKEGKFALAIRKYCKIPEYLEKEIFDLDADKEHADKLQVAANLNLAMCNLKLKNYSDALEACKSALKLEETNEKGLFRMGQAHSGLGNAEEAIETFEKVLKNNPENKDANNQILACKQKIKGDKIKEKALYSKMMAGFSAS